MPLADVPPSSTVQYPKLVRLAAKFWIAISALIVLTLVFKLLEPMVLERGKKPSYDEQVIRELAVKIQAGTTFVFGAMFLFFGITTLRGVVRGMLPYGVIVIVLAVLSIISQSLTIFANVQLLSKPSDSLSATVRSVFGGLEIVISMMIALSGILVIRQNTPYKLWWTARFVKPTAKRKTQAATDEPDTTQEPDPIDLPQAEVKQLPFPKPLKFSCAAWITIGFVNMLVAVVGVGLAASRMMEQRAPTDDVTAAFVVSCVQLLIALAIGGVFIHVGQSTRKGKAKDVQGNGIGSAIFGVYHLVSFALLMPEGLRLLSLGKQTGLAIGSIVGASVSAVFGIVLFFAGMIALAQRKRYKAWRVSTGRIKKKSKTPKESQDDRQPT
jgi:hypothetical protein